MKGIDVNSRSVLGAVVAGAALLAPISATAAIPKPGTIANPYDGVSADDFECYLAHIDASNNVIYDGPVSEDSQAWAQSRIDAGESRVMRKGVAILLKDRSRIDPRIRDEFAGRSAGIDPEVARVVLAELDRGVDDPA